MQVTDGQVEAFSSKLKKAQSFRCSEMTLMRKVGKLCSDMQGATATTSAYPSSMQVSVSAKFRSSSTSHVPNTCRLDRLQSEWDDTCLPSTTSCTTQPATEFVYVQAQPDALAKLTEDTQRTLQRHDRGRHRRRPFCLSMLCALWSISYVFSQESPSSQTADYACSTALHPIIFNK